MLSSKAQHPNCMAKWMNWIESPKTHAQVAEWFGEAPANLKACQQTAEQVALRHVQGRRQAFYEQVKFWATPTKNCRDSRGNQCVDYSKWVQAWTDIKG